jgi:hypothetical protein
LSVIQPKPRGRKRVNPEVLKEVIPLEQQIEEIKAQNDSEIVKLDKNGKKMITMCPHMT